MDKGTLSWEAAGQKVGKFSLRETAQKVSPVSRPMKQRSIGVAKEAAFKSLSITPRGHFGTDGMSTKANSSGEPTEKWWIGITVLMDID